MTVKAHPAANSFPMMDAKRFSELLADIEVNGCIEPITLCDGKILDGRNRNKACQKLGIKPKTRTYNGDPWTYVWSINGERRDLVAEQRYLIWKHCTEKSDAWVATQAKIKETANKGRAKAAKGNANASKSKKNSSGTQRPTTVSHEHKSRSTKAKASKSNAGAVKRGDALAKNHPDLAAAVRSGEMKPAAAHREARRRETSKKVAGLPKGKHTVIYADPPWSYNDAQAVKGDYGSGTGAAVGHYPTMTLGQLKSLDIAGLTAANSVLFLWSTTPLLLDALAVASAWGFSYKAMFVWDKVKHNMGHYNSVRHELLLICTRGSCVPQVSKLFDSVQVIERTKKHSEKPEQFRKIIDTLYPQGNRIELFARKSVENWKAWGNEC